MTSIEVSQSLRPLKFAYVIKPGDFATLERIISVNSFLWGARHNPILPFYKRIPKQLRDEVRAGDAKDLFYGSLEFFEPDFLVLCDGIEESEIDSVPCKILQIDDIAKNVSEEHRPGLGIGIIELSRHYYNQEEKFLRKDKIEYYIPEYGRNCRCFLKSIFGQFPEELSTEAIEGLVEAFDAQKRSISFSDYINYLHVKDFNLQQLSAYKIEIDYTGNVPRDRYVIFYLNPTSFLDIVSYVNLKAAGYVVLPIARDCAKSEIVKELCLNFINEGSWVHPKNPHATTHVMLQKSPTVEEAELENFYKFLSPPKFPDNDWSRCMIRNWLPPFWSRSHQERGDVNCAALTVIKREDEVPLEGSRGVRVQALAPDFVSDHMLETGEARYAIDVAFRSYGSKDFEARIIPTNSKHVAQSCRMSDRREWLINSRGITYFSRYKSRIYFDVPQAQDIFLGWLKSHGWEAEISDAGKVSYQMLRHLDGSWRIIMMKSRKFIKYFSGKLFENNKSVKAQPFVSMVKNEIYKDLRIFWGEEQFLKAILDSKIVQLGTTLQCDVCSRRSWHPISELNYSVRCPHCLSDFEIPTHDTRKIEWSYKTIGPFAARGRSSGAYCVLLTAHFFEHEVNLGGDTTTVLSFKAKKGSEEIEADLGLFYRKGSYFDRTLETIFCECKTFNKFDAHDIERMKKIAEEFPGAILVFSTLNEELTQEEKALIAPLAKLCNRYHERNRPINPVMVLTAIELFADFCPPSAWKNKGGKYEKFGKGNCIRSLLDICQATQQLYLDLDPWSKDWEKVWKKRRNIDPPLSGGKPTNR